MTASYRYRNGGLVRMATGNATELATMRHKGGIGTLSVYGDAPELRRLRASDIRRMAAMSPVERRRLMKARVRQFPGSPFAQKYGAADGSGRR